MTRSILRLLPAAILLAAVLSGPQRACGGDPIESHSVPKKQTNDQVRENRNVGGSDDGLGPWLKTLGALAVVVVLLLAIRLVLRRMGAGAAGEVGNALQVVGRAVVGPRQQMLLVRVGGRVVLVGLHPAGMRTLTEVTDPNEVRAILDGGDPAFAKVMQREMGKFEQTPGPAPAARRTRGAAGHVARHLSEHAGGGEGKV